MLTPKSSSAVYLAMGNPLKFGCCRMLPYKPGPFLKWLARLDVGYVGDKLVWQKVRRPAAKKAEKTPFPLSKKQPPIKSWP